MCKKTKNGLDIAGYPAYNKSMKAGCPTIISDVMKDKIEVVRKPVGSSGGKPLYVNVQERIKKMLCQEDYRVGAKIPGRDFLCKKFKVSDLTVRKAVSHLVDQGILVSKKSQGTFVTLDPKLRKILFLCGLDSFVSETSPFYSHFLNRCQKEAEKYNLLIEPVCIGNDHPETSFSYCNDDFLRGYAGCIFIGCRLSHPLYSYYLGTEQANYVYLTPGPTTIGNCVTTDYTGGVVKAIEHLHKAGNEEIMVFTNRDLSNDIKKVAGNFKKRVDVLELSLPSEAVKCETIGYDITTSLLHQEKMPPAVIFVDDIVARGASRAVLLAHGYMKKKPDWVIFCGLTEIVPLGFPVAYMTLSTDRKAEETLKMLANQINNNSDQPDSYIEKPYLLLPSEQKFRPGDYSVRFA